MNDYTYYRMLYPDGEEWEIIVLKTEWKVTTSSPSYPDDIYELVYAKHNNEWVKMNYEFVVINRIYVYEEVILGFNCYNSFPPGFYER